LGKLNIKNMKYLVIYERAKDGMIWARVPDLEGCYSVGATIAEAKNNINAAIHLHIEVMLEDGMELPDANYMEAELVSV
jgi:predicted RNase H-like HicB family nuclease